MVAISMVDMTMVDMTLVVYSPPFQSLCVVQLHLQSRATASDLILNRRTHRMLRPDFPPIWAIILHVSLHHLLEKESPRLLILEQFLVDLCLVSEVSVVFDGLSELDSGAVEHLVVVGEHTHHWFQCASVHHQRLDVGDLSDHFRCLLTHSNWSWLLVEIEDALN